MSICVVGSPEELMPGFVGKFAERNGTDVLWLDESALGTDWFFEFTDDPEGGRILLGDRIADFSELTGAYVNLSPKPATPEGVESDPENHETFLVLRRASLRHLLNSLPGRVANRPCAGRSNNSKPHQMMLLESAGFSVPRWIASNDPEQARDFTTACGGEAIAKSCSGLRSEVRLFDKELAERLRAGSTPIILQERIAGFDVRLHTVGDRSFGTAIHSAGVDYRFSTGPKDYRSITPPEHVRELCHRFATAEEMVIAGFDFLVTDAGDWYCLEMNPVPTFLPYQFETGQQICEALLEELAPTGQECR